LAHPCFHRHHLKAMLILVLLLNSGCAGRAAQTPASETKATNPTNTPHKTSTAKPPTLPPPSPTSPPPTAYPLPTITASSDQPASHTVCAVGCGFRTIQAAVDAPGTSEGSIIEIRDPIHNEAGIVINKDLTIRGLGVEETIIQAGESYEGAPDRVFYIDQNTTVTLEAMTIQHGNPAVQEEKGGGIRNFGSLTIRNCVIRDNAANGGGGISNSGNLTIVDSTIEGNTADGSGALGLECGNGGGIQCGSGVLLLLNSTVSGNQGGVKGRARGGGIMVGCNCQAVVINSTISNNRASRVGGRTFSGGNSYGGGIYVAGELQLINSTISGNRATEKGGGIYVAKRLDFMNTIIANNIGKGGDCVLSKSEDDDNVRIGMNLYNLVEDGTCAPQFEGDPMLGSLTDNGGFTLTNALRAGSLAIDAIPLEYCLLSTDQRGEERPALQGTDVLSCDIGSFEFQD
jgi:predicted outer membrane repeat protein